MPNAAGSSSTRRGVHTCYYGNALVGILRCGISLVAFRGYEFTVVCKDFVDHSLLISSRSEVKYYRLISFGFKRIAYTYAEFFHQFELCLVSGSFELGLEVRARG